MTRADVLTFLRTTVPGRVRAFAEREEPRFVFDCLLVLVLFTLVRPLFSAPVPREAYDASSMAWDLVGRDWDALKSAAQRQRPAIPRVLFALVPTVIMLVSGRAFGWERWEAGKALRGFMMVPIAMMAWGGSTFGYNTYLGEGHLIDRALLVGLAALSWRTPLAVPFFGTLSVVMIREADFPLGHDDFDWRPLTELLALFSAFVWLSVRKSLQPKHFVFLAVGHWISYYFMAGVSKLKYGPEGKFAWIFENHLSNFTVSSYHKGWLGFLSEPTFLSLASFLRHGDLILALYTILMEAGSIALIVVHPRIARWWFLGAALLNAGIFLTTGVFFWKWIAVNLAFFFFLRGGLADAHGFLWKHKVLLPLMPLLVWFSDLRLWYNPQLGVVWWDSKISEQYHLHGIGESGKAHVIDPRSITPMNTRVQMEAFCYLTGKRISGIYGTMGSYPAFKAFEAVETEEQARAAVRRQTGGCKQDLNGAWDDLMKVYFKRLNREGKKHRWLTWLGRPDHLQTQRQGTFYAGEEPIRSIEVWRERVVYNGREFFRLGKEKVHAVEIPR